MDDVTRQGKASGWNAIEDPDELVRQLRRLLVDEATSRLARHRSRMKADPEYRATVEYLTKLLSAAPGWFGKTVRAVVTGHTLVAGAL